MLPRFCRNLTIKTQDETHQHAHRFHSALHLSDDDIPDYAIPSHTWEPDQEISFQQWEYREHGIGITNKTGFAKIEHFREQAVHDGLE